MDKELDENFFGVIIYKSNYGSAPKHQIESNNISSGLILADALKNCGYDIVEIHFIKKEKK